MRDATPSSPACAPATDRPSRGTENPGRGRGTLCARLCSGIDRCYQSVGVKTANGRGPANQIHWATDPVGDPTVTAVACAHHPTFYQLGHESQNPLRVNDKIAG